MLLHPNVLCTNYQKTCRHTVHAVVRRLHALIFELQDGHLTQNSVARKGMVTVPPVIVAKSMPSTGKECTFFATAGERGIVKIWRSDTGKAVCEGEHLAGTHRGAELMDLMLWGEDKGLMVASADCCLTFLSINVSSNLV